MFYTYNQNNSGGSFNLTETLTHSVVIEADSSSEANDKFESLGGYFNGCENGRDGGALASLGPRHGTGGPACRLSGPDRTGPDRNEGDER